MDGKHRMRPAHLNRPEDLKHIQAQCHGTWFKDYGYIIQWYICRRCNLVDNSKSSAFLRFPENDCRLRIAKMILEM